MTEPMLTLDEAYRATFHFIRQYYQREPVVPLALMLSAMTGWESGANLRETADPATWDDWTDSVRHALESAELPPIG